MKAHGMDSERVDLNEYTKVFAESMRAGLRGDADAMPMIPTYLSPSGKLPRGEKAVVIDAGGTNFRTAVISFDTKGAVIEQQNTLPMPGAQEPVTWDEFISKVADAVLPLMAQAKDIGFCFSYPIEITPERDGRVLGLTKQVKIEDAVGKLLGALHSLQAVRHT